MARDYGMMSENNMIYLRSAAITMPGGLPSLGSHRVGHDGSDLAAAAITIAAVRIPGIGLVLPWFPKDFYSHFLISLSQPPCALNSYFI